MQPIDTLGEPQILSQWLGRYIILHKTLGSSVIGGETLSSWSKANAYVGRTACVFSKDTCFRIFAKSKWKLLTTLHFSWKHCALQASVRLVWRSFLAHLGRTTSVGAQQADADAPWTRFYRTSHFGTFWCILCDQISLECVSLKSTGR